TIVKALLLGRKAIGLDINALAHFVTTVKTTPLNENDLAVLGKWSTQLRSSLRSRKLPPTEAVRNLPPEIQKLCSALKIRIDELPLERPTPFSHCVVFQRVPRAKSGLLG